jgi:ribonuclease R
VHIARLGADRFEYVERRQELVGTRTGRTFRLGDRLRVLLERIDPVLRRVDLSIETGSDEPARARTGPRKERHAKPGPRRGRARPK